MSLIDGLRKFSARSRQERGLFIEAFVLLGMMRAAILLFPFRKITGIMKLTQGVTPSIAVSSMSINLSYIGWSIQAAAASTPWESACLAQALTGMVMLSRRGIGATLYLGVARDENGSETMTAHAWLRCGEVILTGGGGVERFSAISSFSRPPATGTRRRAHIDRTGP